MAQSFTDEEVADAVDQFLLTKVEVPRLGTGNRNVVLIRDRVYDLLSISLMMQPDAYFYIIWFAKNRAMSLLAKQLESMDRIDQWALAASGLYTSRIETTAELSNAKAAILNINAGLNDRTSGVQGSIGPAVDRFRKSVEGFINEELSRNVVKQGSVVPTVEELRENVSSEWAIAVNRQYEIEYLLGNISSAIDELRQVRLPQSTVQGIVARITSRLDTISEEMDSPAAGAQSRKALLDLMTMRSLLTKASTFRVPSLVLYPLKADTRTTLPVKASSTGRMTSSLSGGFLTTPGDAALSGDVLLLDLGSHQESAAIMSDSRPTVEGLKGSVPFGAPASAQDWRVVVRLDSDNARQYSHFIPQGTTYVDGVALALDIANGLVLDGMPPSEAEVMWHPDEMLVFRRTGLDRLSSVEVMPIDDESVRFSVFVMGGVTRGIIEPTPIAALEATLSSIPGVEATITTDFVETYSATALSVSSDRAYGDVGSIVVGDWVRITKMVSPVMEEWRSVSAVDPLGSYIEFSTTITAESGDPLYLNVQRHTLTLEGTSVSTNDYLMLDAVTPTSTRFGLIPGSEEPTTFTTAELQGAGNLIDRGVQAGDLVFLTHVGSGTEHISTVSSTTATQVTVEDRAEYQPGNWEMEVQSSRYASYLGLKGYADEWLSHPLVVNFQHIDKEIAKIMRGALYAPTNVIGTTVHGYIGSLTAVQSGFRPYAPEQERTIDSIVSTMREQGLDRALHLMLSLEIVELFTMSADAVSYKTNMVRVAATATREVAPVSKMVNRGASGARHIATHRTRGGVR